MARTFQPSPWSITGGPLSQAGSAITGNNLTRAMGALRSKNSGYDSIYSDQIGNVDSKPDLNFSCVVKAEKKSL